MKYIVIILSFLILVSFGFTQEKPEKINSTKVEKIYSKEKAEQVKTVNNGKLIKENKMFGSTKNSGKEITLNKTSIQNTITNEELGKKLNNPKRLKK